MKKLGFTLFESAHRFYEMGDILFSLRKASNGYYELIEKDKQTGDRMKYLFSNLEGALSEMVSYCEISGSDFEEV